MQAEFRRAQARLSSAEARPYARALSCATAIVCAALTPVALSAPAPHATPANVHPDLWPAPSDPSAKHDEIEAFVSALLARMSLEEKIAQMIQADISALTPDDLRTYKLGAVLAGGGSAPGNNVRTTPQAWLDLTDALQRAALQPSTEKHQPIPILFGVDAVHGHAKIIGATIFPHNIGLGAAHDPHLIERIGRATAEEVAATGIDWTFAPTVAVARDVRWGRIYESYSEDPALVSEYAAAMVKGLQGEPGTSTFMSRGSTLASVKHFLGDGGTREGRDQGNNPAPESSLSRIHAAGYAAGIQAGAMIVMASYNGWHGVKMHANSGLLTDVLKGRLGFNGFVVGDWNAHEEIPGCTKFNCPTTILAGLDMFMAPDSWKEIYRNTLQQVRSGQVPQARIDDAVRRILRVKALSGLFNRPPPKERPDAGHFEVLGSPEHRALAREAVRKSLVLLKNNRATLPLSPRSHVLVAGNAADSIAIQSGGWTIDWQGDHNTNADFPGATSIFAGIKGAVAAAGGKATLSPDGQFADKPDVAIVVFGETPYAEYEGDRETVQFSPTDHGSLELLKRLHSQGIPTVAVLVSGRPLWVNPELNAVDAFVAAWLPGSEGAGVADGLFAAAGHERFDFTGRLSFSWPETGMPVTFDDHDQPRNALFKRGFGLRYADRALPPAKLSEDPRIPTDRGGPDALFHAAHVVAPWSIFVADHLAQVRLTMQSQSSPNGAVIAALNGGGAAGKWRGGETGDWWIGGRPVDLQAAAQRGDSVSIRFRVDERPERAVWVGLRCAATSQAEETRCGSADAMLDRTQDFTDAPVGSWHTLSIPLACFAKPGADLSNVAAPFAMRTDGRFAVSLAEVRFESTHTHSCEAAVAKQ